MLKIKNVKIYCIAFAVCNKCSTFAKNSHFFVFFAKQYRDFNCL